MNPTIAQAAPKGWTRLGTDPTKTGPALICMNGAGEAGKSRLAAAACRAWPERFGPRAVLVCVDPEAEALGPVLLEDRPNMERVVINHNVDVFDQLKDIYKYNWKAEGITTIVTDTMTVATQSMLAQVTNSGKFSERHVDLGGGIKAPMMGDYGAVQTLTMSLLRMQQQSGMNHICLFHDQEVRPDAGQPGEPIGGPATVGKAGVRGIVNWYNTVLHIVRRPRKRTDMTKPQEMERVVYTTGHGIWQAKLRTPNLVNPISEILMEPDPANVWKVLSTLMESK